MMELWLNCLVEFNVGFFFVLVLLVLYLKIDGVFGVEISWILIWWVVVVYNVLFLLLIIGIKCRL